MLASLAFLPGAPLPFHRRSVHLNVCPPRASGASNKSSSAGPTVAATPVTNTGVEQPRPYACPRCRTAVAPLSSPTCPSCSASFPVNNGFFDMTPPSPQPTALTIFTSLAPRTPKEAIFQSPLVSFAYERGWRAVFARAGFPGIDEEFSLFQEFLSSSADDPVDVVVDLSCGSGLMARRLAGSGLFRKVIAADLSAAMLREAGTRAEEAGVAFDLVRADVTALPFADGGIDAVHAGAALHCWDRIQDALAEVRRVLVPGGSFFASTFLKGAYAPTVVGDIGGNEVGKIASQLVDRFGTRPYRFFEVDELIFLARAAGFVDVQVQVFNKCVILTALKPE